MELTRKAQLLDFVQTYGDRWPSYAIRAVDVNGKALTAFAPKMFFKVRKIDTEEQAVKTLTVGDGFKKEAAEATFYFDTAGNLPPGKYIHYLQLVLAANGWKFTMLAGHCIIVLPGSYMDNVQAAPSVITIVLPISIDETTGNIALEAEGGEGVLVTEGDDPQTLVTE